MTDGLLFLREEDLRLAQALLWFAARDLGALTEPVLAGRGLGPAQYRALYAIGRNPGLTVGALLGLLGVTKQSLHRVLGELKRQGLVGESPSRVDRRQRLLTLTEAGLALERDLFEAERARLARACRVAGGPAVEGFRRVLRLMLDEKSRALLDRSAGRPGG